MRLITGRLEARDKSGELDAQAAARKSRSHFPKQGKSLKAARQHHYWVADRVSQTRTRREGAAEMQAEPACWERAAEFPVDRD